MSKLVPSRLSIFLLFRGLLGLTICLLPISLFLTLFVSTMAGGGPGAPSLLVCLGLGASFIYLLPLLILLVHCILAVVFDCVVSRKFERPSQVSLVGIFFAAFCLVAWFNYSVDHLFQINQGNYTMAFFPVVGFVGYILVLNQAGKMPLKILDRWFPSK